MNASTPADERCALIIEEGNQRRLQRRLHSLSHGELRFAREQMEQAIRETPEAERIIMSAYDIRVLATIITEMQRRGLEAFVNRSRRRPYQAGVTHV